MSAEYEQVADWVRRFAAVVAQRNGARTNLDPAIGAGDHGTNMDRGLRKAVEKLDAVEGNDIGAALKAVGMALVSSVGGAGGPLYGTFFLQAGQAAAGRSELDTEGLAAMVRAGVAGVQARGKAEPEDKTMVDALLPAAAALEQGGDLAEAAARAADAAEEGMRATTDLVARKGRASYLGERSRGHQDPGATSSALMIRAAAQAFTDQS
jgi:dihydroxyacetone kinase-like protein